MDTRQAKPILLTSPAFEDFRGYLAVPYDQYINFSVRQINQGFSKKAGTLRGLHFQDGEYAQAKLVSCLHGSIFNVAVDLRKGETFGHAYSAVLSFENRKQMYIPRGFAHGYLTLEDDTLMQWCVADGPSCGPCECAGQPGGVPGPVQHLLHLPDPAPADRTVGSECADGGGIQKKPRKSEREMTTPLFLLRCVQLGISIADLDLLTIGLVNDMFTERQNDGYSYKELASQSDFDRF